MYVLGVFGFGVPSEKMPVDLPKFLADFGATWQYELASTRSTITCGNSGLMLEVRLPIALE